MKPFSASALAGTTSPTSFRAGSRVGPASTRSAADVLTPYLAVVERDEQLFRHGLVQLRHGRHDLRWRRRRRTLREACGVRRRTHGASGRRGGRRRRDRDRVSHRGYAGRGRRGGRSDVRLRCRIRGRSVSRLRCLDMPLVAVESGAGRLQVQAVADVDRQARGRVLSVARMHGERRPDDDRQRRGAQARRVVTESSCALLSASVHCDAPLRGPASLP